MTDAPTRPDGRASVSSHGRGWLTVAVLAALLVVLLRTVVVESFTVPSDSMAPTIHPGDRLLANRLVRGPSVHRGDIVVFDGSRAFAAAGSADYVKRVVGQPGDHVVCCAPSGQLVVNGVPLTEPYLQAGDRPSELTFDVTVPAGRIWVMGDHRSDSSDSRAYLGQPGGGMVPLDDVIGQVAVRYWPLGRLGSLGGAASLSSFPPTPGASH